MALGAFSVWAKYSYGVWEGFARQETTILDKTTVWSFCSAVGAMPSTCVSSSIIIYNYGVDQMVDEYVPSLLFR